ncbi:MAG TPA: condensation domain-containing protein, partial [Candidatus Deferrimicrobium sp.]|nr:condensation domain-containing protein [Candidatus Deferrimicrobium sp.]
LTGARVMMGNVEEQLNAEAAAAILDRDRITILQVTPSRLQIFISFPGSAGSLKRLNYLLVGGEAFPRHLLEKVKPLLHKQARIYNLYGPTETTIWSTLKDLSHENVITIGKPLANTYIYIVDHDGEWQPIGKTGELCIGGEGLARGYLNNPELTAEKFIMKRSDRSDKTSNKRSNKTFILYKTGDQAKWLPDGNIEFLGRNDRQVKIRGFRIELGEIENRLLSHPKVREVVVVPQESDGGKDKYLCIYIVPAVYPVETLETAELQDYLAAALPDYMVPAYFVILERIPLNPNGKVDLKALPEPDRSAGKNHVPPQNEIENVLAGIWADILGIDREQVGIHDNFFRMGGHSLKATVLTGRIQKAFSVAIPIPELFKTPTIKGIANYIARTGKSVYLPLQPAEEKEYYPLSSTQKRLYLLNQADKSSKAYNMPAVFFLEGQLKKERLTGICKQLTRRHESFRTSFAQIEGEPVQRVHREVNFEIEYYDLTAQGAMGSEAEKIHLFIRAFDLTKAPLLRVGLIETGVGEYILVFDMHHIISDGASMGLSIREFMVLYEGKTLPLPRIQYKDYTEWQRSETWQESLKEAEAFWLEHLQGVGSRPRLKLPADFDRPAVRNFAGATFEFELGSSETARLKQLAKEEETTLYMLLLALYFVLLVRLSGQEDITVGTPVVGRQREEFQPIIGMFVNTLAMRHFPKMACPFKNFLKEVKEKTINVFKYQDYPFERLIEKVESNPDNSHNPLFDVMLTFQNIDIPTFQIPGLTLKPYPYKNVTAKFDLNLICSENNETLLFALEYSTNLFKADTIGRFAGYFKDIIAAILENRDKKMGDINMSLEFSESKSDLSLEAVGDFRF